MLSIRDNPMEKRFLDAWEKYRWFNSDVRPWQAREAFIKWLATPSGLAFLEEALGIGDIRKETARRYFPTAAVGLRAFINIGLLNKLRGSHNPRLKDADS